MSQLKLNEVSYYNKHYNKYFNLITIRIQYSIDPIFYNPDLSTTKNIDIYFQKSEEYETVYNGSIYLNKEFEPVKSTWYINGISKKGKYII